VFDPISTKTLPGSSDAATAPLVARPSTVREVVLTGDRPTGPLHLGHFAGSLRTRLELQEKYSQTLLIADLQALTDNVGRATSIADHVFDVALDYLAIGIDPGQTTIAVQSQLPALAELTVLYLNLVTVSRLERNPTVKAEIELRGFARDIPAGFLCYPVSQATDITGFRGTIVPVGEDQVPMIEQTNEIVRRVNRIAGVNVLPECRALLSRTPRLPGTDGRKASKSLGNAISLSASADEIRLGVRAMFTDPGHQRASDPGRVEGNVVFAYLDAFDPDEAAVAALKDRYQAGGLGDVAIKRRLEEVLEAVISPIRERRRALVASPDYVRDVVRDGTSRARTVTDAVAADVKRAFALTPFGA
jgi:tryptophanyl-tRNA synthetase